ncbi:MAG: hypothetical protein BGO53_09010 [Sphingobacteriales bacterium 39-19]|nr:hypothetical protein [Sphingobacteriales bacterium]OJW09954.1 MAG: hypothetical protein BGO53_09010 [Sphingobacteriales bacterium 39-19]
MSDLKKAFILQSVEEYLRLVAEALPVSLRKKKIGITDELIRSIRTQASQQGEGAVGKLFFNESGRFVDMGVGRAHPLGGVKAVTVKLLSQKKEGIALMKASGRKPKKWYSPVVYAKLNYLENRLLHGFTEEAKKELEKMKP